MLETREPSLPVLIPEDVVRTRVQELGQQISADYQGRDLLLVSILRGSGVRVADLMRQLAVPFEATYPGFSGYGSRGSTSGEARITFDTPSPVEGRHLLVCDGAVISGLTLTYVVDWFRLRGAASVHSCALPVKPQLKVNLAVDYAGFRIGDEFAVGYGISHGGRYAGLPHVGLLAA